MEFIQLKYFQALAETGKINAAAEAMFVTPPAVSSAIALLESELGTPLFSRERNRFVLNEQGEILLKHTDKIMYHFSAAKTALMESVSEDPAQVSIVATQAHLLTGPVAAFFAAHPEHTVTLHSSDGENVLRGAFKQRHAFLITTENNVPAPLAEECFHVPLFSAEPVVMVARDHALAQRDRVSVADIAGYSLIHPKSYPDYCARIFALYENLGLPLPLIRTYSHMVCRALTQQNGAVSLLTTHADADSGKPFVLIPLESNGIRWETHLFWRKNRKLTQPERTLLEFMASYYGFAIPSE